MQECKYYYENIPLTTYCKDNDINISTIRTRIWKKKQSKKYQNYTDQEIVNMVIEAYGTAVKYMYKGVTLRQYCLKNEINIGTINSRISNLKKQNPSLSNDELVIIAMEEFDNQNYRFFYEGIPLKEYCELHPEINYNTIRTYINREQEKNPSLTDEELIKQYIDKEHKGIYKYYYLGIPLKQYCEENNLNYRNIISYMCRYKNTDKYKGLTDDEFVAAIIDVYQPFEPKYVYNGMTLSEYCKKNDLSYYSVVSFVKRKLTKNPEKSIDELIDEGIKTIKRHGIIYYYKGIPLIEYAKENNLNASSIRCSIIRKKSKENRQLQEIIDECVETYQKFTIKYYYNDEPLISFCSKIGLNYNTVIQVYLDKYSRDQNITIDEAIKLIVDYYIEKPPIRTKYYFNNQSLSKFCDEKEYSYLAIWRRIKRLKDSNNQYSTEEIIEQSISMYEAKLKIQKLNECFKNLKTAKYITSEDLLNLCGFLKIDYENLQDLFNMNFTINQSINMIWYFSDITNDNGYKIISDKKIEELFSLTERIKQADEKSVSKFELYDLIGIYKSELYDSRSEILLRQERYIYKTIYTLCREYDIPVTKANIEDFKSEIKMYLIMLIDKTSVNIYGQIIKYMDLTVKGYFRTYLKKYRQETKPISLNSKKYSSDKGNKNGKVLIDYIADTKSRTPEFDEMSFGTEMMKCLSKLSDTDMTFIILRFQENYQDNELAEYFHMSIEEVKEKELSILTSLKNNDDIKRLKK